MAAELIFTAGEQGQIDRALQGPNLQGHGEPRIALVGRSNVGKSSLINALTRSTVARTSGTPGKTRLLHFYAWKETRKILVDLPGYGFARASGKEQGQWGGLINGYLAADEGLERALVVLDARHGPTENDEQAIRFLGFGNLPVSFVFSKTDELKTQSERARRRREAAQALERLGYDPAEAVWVSARQQDGIPELVRKLGGK